MSPPLKSSHLHRFFHHSHRSLDVVADDRCRKRDQQSSVGDARGAGLTPKVKLLLLFVVAAVGLVAIARLWCADGLSLMTLLWHPLHTGSTAVVWAVTLDSQLPTDLATTRM